MRHFTKKRGKLVRRRVTLLLVFVIPVLSIPVTVPAAGTSVKLPPASRSVQAGPAAFNPESHTVARMWNEVMLEAIRNDQPRVTVHARNLFHVSAAMYDAWAAYSANDQGVFHQESARPDHSIEADRMVAISHAAHGVLSHRFAVSPGHQASQAMFDELMDLLGLDPADTSTLGGNAAALGNRVAASVIELNLHDGANELRNYRDVTGYNPVNLAMFVALPGTGGLADANAWQPLITLTGSTPQSFLTPHWYAVKPFALERAFDEGLYMDAGPHPRFGEAGHERLIADMVGLIEASSWLDPADGVRLNASPAVIGNNSLGSNDGSGHEINPATGEPYVSNSVLRGDWARVVAEFWEDGPRSSTPPGHWNEIANQVNQHLEGDRLRIAGQGLPVDRLEWEVKLYLALNGAVHDAGIASWENKFVYDNSRPITLIRYLSELGQSSDPTLPSYHSLGLPLIEGLIELVTAESAAPGARHEHLADHLGEVVLRAWQGYPQTPSLEHGGVGWIRGVEWLPYQADDFITPAFPGYVSGHSTFSRAAATVLTLMTGSPYFPGGLAEFEMDPDGLSLNFEFGPSEPVRLQWASYYDAADEAGRSRIFGGIHPDFDDFPGRLIGDEVGATAHLRALEFFSQQTVDARPVEVPALSHRSLIFFALLLAAFGLNASQNARRAKRC